MQNERRAQVSVGGVPAGVIEKRGQQFSFQFTETYLGTTGRPVLGQHFEDRLRTRLRSTRQVPNWFANLLPEGKDIRKWLTEELNLEADDDLGLLIATGSDLPGSVRIAEYDGGDEVSAAWASEHVPLKGEPSGGLRFSVAGVQLKLSVALENNTIRLAGVGELGGWYAKIAGALQSVPSNEFHNLLLASEIGLDVPRIELRTVAEEWLPERLRGLAGRDVFLIERFDRVGETRIHIEDFNQVKGQAPGEKYEGMSAEGLTKFVLLSCGESDFWEAFRRIVFNILVGNEDAHLKNWSLVYPDGRNPRLAPLYDVVSTVVYPEFVRTHGQNLGGSKRAETYSVETLLRLARKNGMSPTKANEEYFHVIERVREAEHGVRGASQLDASHWSSLDSYRRTVPMARPLVK